MIEGLLFGLGIGGLTASYIFYRSSKRMIDRFYGEQIEMNERMYNETIKVINNFYAYIKQYIKPSSNVEFHKTTSGPVTTEKIAKEYPNGFSGGGYNHSTAENKNV